MKSSADRISSPLSLGRRTRGVVMIPTSRAHTIISYCLPKIARPGDGSATYFQGLTIKTRDTGILTMILEVHGSRETTGPLKVVPINCVTRFLCHPGGKSFLPQETIGDFHLRHSRVPGRKAVCGSGKRATVFQ